jgi:hypothetical protein
MNDDNIIHHKWGRLAAPFLFTGKMIIFASNSKQGKTCVM